MIKVLNPYGKLEHNVLVQRDKGWTYWQLRNYFRISKWKVRRIIKRFGGWHCGHCTEQLRDDISDLKNHNCWPDAFGPCNDYDPFAVGPCGQIKDGNGDHYRGGIDILATKEAIDIRSNWPNKINPFILFLSGLLFGHIW